MILVPPVKGKLKLYFYLIKLWGNFLSILGCHRKYNLLVDCHAVFHYHHIKPLVDDLIKDDKVNLFILECDSFSEQYVPPELIERKFFISPNRAKYMMFDMTISLDYYGSAWIPHRGISVLAPHGDGVKSNYTGNQRISNYDIVFAVGENMAVLQQPYVKENAIVEKVGFIINDMLSEDEGAETKEYINFGNDNPVILYAPSWSSDSDKIMVNQEILYRLSNQKKFNIIFKPHPHLLISAECGGKDFKSMFDENRSNNFIFIEKSFIPIQIYMKNSDILVSDFSSVIFEYLYLDKPILIHVNKEVINSYQGEDSIDQIKDAAFQFSNPNEIINKIETALQNKHIHSVNRRQVLQNRYYNIGRAKDAAKNAIYKALKIK